MELLKLLLANLMGTSMMTVFTYALSEIFKKQYKQPVLIEYFQTIFNVQLSHRAKRFNGWLLHYFTGAGFLLLFQIYWRFDDNAVTWASGILFGLLSGILGVLVWKLFFQILKKKITPDAGFYTHIFLAHFVFSLGVVAFYKLLIFINLIFGS